MGRLSRRRFLRALGWSAAAMTYQGSASGTTAKPEHSFEYGQPLREFGYSQVQFQPCLQQAQLEQTHALLMGLSEDGLLKPYREQAGLPAPGCNLSGWYSSDRFRGETFGQWVSALARYYAITGDQETRTKVNRLVDALAATVEPTGKIFVYGHGESPAYLYDKLVCGLVDAHKFAKSPSALDTLRRATLAASPKLPGRALDELADGDTGESYTLPENQFIAWQRSGEATYLEMAKAYLHRGFFDPLARGQNVLAGRHAYSHVNALSSAAKAYLVLGDSRYLRAARNGLSFVQAQSFATGGWGPNEAFIPSPALTNPDRPYPAIDSLADALRLSHWHFETCCGAYAHFKVTRYLLRITKDSLYGDSMERVMYNTVLGAKPLLQDGRAFYQSDYSPGTHKFYFDGYLGALPSEWPCCSGTLTQLASDYRLSTYLRDQEGIYVNLYIPSTVTWRQGAARVSLTQSGSYPLDDVVSLVLSTSSPCRMALRLRVPAWTSQPILRINGARVHKELHPGSFAVVVREWRSGDRIDLELPRQIALQSLDSKRADLVAVTCGPLVLMTMSEETPEFTRAQLLAASQTSPAAAQWVADSAQGRMTLAPFWMIRGQRYTTYQKVV
jgi:uncharacterized protein